MTLDSTIFSRARMARDRHFDGLFFFGVSSTGVFCRPVCPAAPSAREENVTYFPTATAAVEAGFRPCLRCRPESAPGNWNSFGEASLVERALEIIRDGGLNDISLEDLAGELGTVGRHLRRVFQKQLGATPVQIARVQRTLFAKKLLSESNLSVTQTAMAAGFGSLRQFNDVFREVFGQTPTEVKRVSTGTSGNSDGACRLYLSYRPDFDWAYMLEFMRPRIIPGVEVIDGHLYKRTYRTGAGNSGWLEVSDCPERSALLLAIHTDSIDDVMRIQQRVRTMFDLEANLEPVKRHLAQDPLLADIVRQYPALRLPGTWDPFEFATRAILGQQISVRAATTLAARVASTCGILCDASFPDGLHYFFPTAEEIADADLSGLGITGVRQQTIKNMVDAVLKRRISFSRGQTMETFVASLTSVKGIGPWTAHYLGMRALGMTDAFPASDLGIRKALAVAGKLPAEKAVIQRSEPWRPWRAYAALYLWKLASLHD